MKDLNPIILNQETTVISEFIKNTNKKSNTYQTESDLEKELINNLQKLGYEYINIKNEKDLKLNLRNKIEKLNNIKFSDTEWESFFKTEIANKKDGIIEKTKKIQEETYLELIKDDNTSKNIKIIDKNDLSKNSLQVINQYSENSKKTRYDVTILINGLPLIHIELKRRGVSIREAFNQIERYKINGFSNDDGLFEYIQIFVISNGTYTKYYSNTTRENHIKEIKNINKKKSSNSFEFTSYWADSKNNVIANLEDFTITFFQKNTILRLITMFSIFTTDNVLMIMRPYQITAAEKIINKINIAKNYKKEGSIDAGGYIWHTTGSGKTLTSFKTAQLATNIDFIDKVIFVVDRKDLDYQTIKEYDKFQKGCANSNANTNELKKQLENPNTKIIITTIQKLSIFVDKNKKHDIYNKDIVIIFDECHRSQFGDMHKKIKKSFKKYYMFGFTGTPIFAENKNKSSAVTQTTEQLFGTKLHTYTIVDAINDKNVLPFKIDYVGKIENTFDGKDKKIAAIDKEKALLNPDRLNKIVDYILENFDKKTIRCEYYNIDEKRKLGFNSIFAVESIDMAKEYYKIFKNKNTDLKISTIFSYSPNIDDESLDVDSMDNNSKIFLQNVIDDYNKMFNTNFDISNFDNYYKDISMRMKNRELDLLIVVNMFLTGFDATTLNTLWIDKNLKMHGLIQAFSRTNRILNSVKQYGNIICFRNLEKETNEAIALFGNKDAKNIICIKDFNSYYNGYDEIIDGKKKHHKGYTEILKELSNKFPINNIGNNIKTNKNKKEFINLYSKLLRLENICKAFSEFDNSKKINDRDMQDYKSTYIDLYKDRKKHIEIEDISDDIEFEIELIKQVEINIDYILMLVEKYHKENNIDVLTDINKAIDSSIQLKSKKALISDFINKTNNHSNITNEWKEYVDIERKKELDELIKEENLKPEKTNEFIENSFTTGYIETKGDDIDKILPKISLFKSSKNKENKITIKNRVINKIFDYFEKYSNIISK